MTNDGYHRAADWAAGAITVGTLLGALPHIAAALSVVWGLIRIFETRTVQRAARCLRNRLGF